MTAPVIAATTASYQALDAAYRAALATTSMAVLQIMMAEWRNVRADDLARTSARWLAASTAAIVSGQRRAISITNAYALQTRRMSIPDAEPFVPDDQFEPNLEQLNKSLTFTGIVTTAREVDRVNAIVQGKPYADEDVEELRELFERDQSDARTAELRKDQLMQDAITRASAAAIRHITAAAFEQQLDNIQQDPRGVGWYRTTRAGCCYFCAMLASRGPVFKERSFEESNAKFKGPGEQKVHDSCGCGLRGFYSTDDPMPDQTEEFMNLWANEAARFSGPEAVKKFRQAYEGRKKPE